MVGGGGVLGKWEGNSSVLGSEHVEESEDECLGSVEGEVSDLRGREQKGGGGGWDGGYGSGGGKPVMAGAIYSLERVRMSKRARR